MFAVDEDFLMLEKECSGGMLGRLDMAEVSWILGGVFKVSARALRSLAPWSWEESCCDKVWFFCLIMASSMSSIMFLQVVLSHYEIKVLI